MAYDGDSQVAKGVIGTIVVIITLGLGPIWYGYVFSLLWLWFVVPTFALPVLGKALAIGLAVTIKFVTNQTIDCKEKKEDKTFYETLGSTIAKTFLIPAISLLYGYIVKQFL